MRPIWMMSFFLVWTGLLAQPYHPLVDTTATWQDWFYGSTPGPDTGTWECYLYYLEGDSSVNDTLYKVLRKTGHMRHHFGLPPDQQISDHWYSGDPIALLREDTAARQVFIRWGFPMEGLLYDFSVDLGPYPTTYRYPDWADFEVTSVDVIELSNGPHRRITFNEGEETIIEGIGSTSSFLLSNSGEQAPWPQPRLVCHSLDDIQDWESTLPPVSGCLCGADMGLEEPAQIGLSISPTPTHDICQIRGAQPNAQFFIRCIDGRTVRSGSCSSNGSTTVDMTGLPAAIYFVEVAGASGQATGRIIKQ